MNELLDIIESLEGSINDIKKHPENDEHSDYAEALCIEMRQKVKNLCLSGVINWLPLIKDNYEKYTELAKENKLLKKFDDGSVIKQGNKEPFAICTHFAEMT